MFSNFRLPVFFKHHVVGWFSSLFHVHQWGSFDNNTCIVCGKKAVGLPKFQNPPSCPVKGWSNKVTPGWFNSVRKYTIENPDEYDLEFGIGVEIGIFTIEDYYYTKGWTKAWRVSRNHPSIE
jgi:hypothetical protein